MQSHEGALHTHLPFFAFFAALRELTGYMILPIYNLIQIILDTISPFR